MALGPAPAQAQETGTVAGHVAEDSVVHTAAEERSLQQQSRRDTAADAAAAAAATDGSPAQTGSWGPVLDWPVVGVHVALLPNGKVLAYDSVGDHATETYPDEQQITSRATVWDPATNAHTPVNVNTGYNVFCSGLAHLTDGSIFLAGGNKDTALHGIRKTHLFNPETNTWFVGNDMQAERWYPSVTALPDGRMLITSGASSSEGDPRVQEIRATDGGMGSLAGADRSLELYPWFEVAPDGRLVNVGPASDLNSLTVDGMAGTWREEGQRDGVNRHYGSHALYDIGKVLVAGGGMAGPDGSSTSARVVDLNGPNATVTPTQDMAFGRRQHNLTVLADGTVLATGGNFSGIDLIDKDNGVYNAERWDPATGTWTTLAAEARTRQYHSTALLLPDGRVMSAGGGVCAGCDASGYLEKNAQVFTPPYLYDVDGGPASRPAITGAPKAVGYGRMLDIGTPQSASIQKVALVRLGAVTHSVNMDQRYVPLSFTRNGGGVLATAPANANIAPPGVYMLFVLDDHGVPSVSRMVSVGATVADAAPAVALTQPAAGTVPTSFTAAASASDPDGSVAKVTFYVDGRAIAEDTSAPYSAPVSALAVGDHALTAVAIDGLGLGATSTQVAVKVGAPGTTPPTGTTPPKGAPALRLGRLVVLGSTSRTRKLRVTASAAATAELRLARQRGRRLLTLEGRRTVKLRKGVTVISLKDSWNRHRLIRGRYAVTVRVGRTSVRASFSVR